MPDRIAQHHQLEGHHRTTHAYQHAWRFIEEELDVVADTRCRQAEHDEMQAERSGCGGRRRLGHAQHAKEQRYAQHQAEHHEAVDLRHQNLPDEERHWQCVEDPAQEHHADLRRRFEPGEQAAHHAGQQQRTGGVGPASGQPECSQNQEGQRTARAIHQRSLPVVVPGQGARRIGRRSALLDCEQGTTGVLDTQQQHHQPLQAQLLATAQFIVLRRLAQLLDQLQQARWLLLLQALVHHLQPGRDRLRLAAAQ